MYKLAQMSLIFKKQNYMSFLLLPFFLTLFHRHLHKESCLGVLTPLLHLLAAPEPASLAFSAQGVLLFPWLFLQRLLGSSPILLSASPHSQKSGPTTYLPVTTFSDSSLGFSLDVQPGYQPPPGHLLGVILDPSLFPSPRLIHPQSLLSLP